LTDSAEAEKSTTPRPASSPATHGFGTRAGRFGHHHDPGEDHHEGEKAEARSFGEVTWPESSRCWLRALRSREYVISLKGVEVSRYELPQGCELAIPTSTASGPIDGQATRDPAFGMNAFWIPSERSERARQTGYTVVDSVSVLGTHLSELIRRYAHELFSRQDAKRLLDRVAVEHPKVVEDVVPKLLPLSTVQRVLQNLLANAFDAVQSNVMGPKRVSVSVTPKDDDVMFTISDTGAGIPAEVRDRLFRPVSSTKAVGMGLGLAICRSLIEANDGRISLLRSGAEGTSIAFWIPIAVREADEADR